MGTTADGRRRGCGTVSRTYRLQQSLNANKEVVAVLDIDSKELACFDETDRHYLESAMQSLSKAVF